MHDVIVVGAGPAGSAAAKRCAQSGLNTLILEKEVLPRNKVCSGIVLGPVADIIIKNEFGNLPESILCQPGYLSGVMSHVVDIGSQRVDNVIALTWRKNLDYWMNRKALEQGAKILEGVRFTGLSQEGQGFRVEIEKDKKRSEIQAKFVVGADGATSAVRRSVFPELKMKHVFSYQEHYEGKLDLDKKYLHTFRSLGHPPMRFAVIHKDNLFLLTFTAGAGELSQGVKPTKDFLSKNYRFDTTQKPVHKEACPTSVMHKELISRGFTPALGNCLLVGEAGGFNMPVILEGIGLGIKTGLLAADSIVKAVETNKQADKFYLADADNIISIFNEMQPIINRVAEETEHGGHSLPELLSEAARSAIRRYESYTIDGGR